METIQRETLASLLHDAMVKSSSADTAVRKAAAQVPESYRQSRHAKLADALGGVVSGADGRSTEYLEAIATDLSANLANALNDS